MTDRTCSIEGCDRRHYALGWCQRHYSRDGRVKLLKPLPIHERFWPKVDRRGPDECWPWLARLNVEGYGTFSVGRTMLRAHRVAYELLVGPIPDGLVIDHTCHTLDPTCMGSGGCRHRSCMNPAHMEPVPRAVNSSRGRQGVVNGAIQRAKTHCPQGHPYDEVNTRHNTAGRACRACQRDNARIYRARKRTV